MSGTAHRFSDDKLNEFYDEFKAHEKEESDISRQLLDCLGDNRRAIDEIREENRAAIAQIRNDTRELIEAWQAAEGAVKVAGVLGAFVKWLSGVAVIGWLVVEMGKHIDKIK